VERSGTPARNPSKLISFNVKARRADKNTGRRWSEAKPLQGNFLQREKPEGLIRIQAGGGAKRNPCKQIETENKPLKG
jgi:hypothetical protein